MTKPRVLVSIRVAQPEDGPAILAMLAALASFEGAAHALRLDAAALAEDVFSSTPKLNILIAQQAAGSELRRFRLIFQELLKLGGQSRYSHRRFLGLSGDSRPGRRISAASPCPLSE
jgi:hypothetical protein